MSKGLVYRDCHGALQTAIFNRLKALTVGGKQKFKVFDIAPKSEEFPYITVNEQTTSNTWDTKTFAGQEVTYVVAIWTSHEGNAQAQNMANEVSYWLTNWDWDLTDNFNVINVKRLQSFPVVLEDGRHIKWILRFEIHVKDSSVVQLNQG